MGSHHYARDGSWFTDYTPLDATVNSGTGGIVVVNGVGTVPIDVL